MIGTATSVINRTLSSRVKASIDELESGGGERFETLEELFKSWDELSDDALVNFEESLDDNYLNLPPTQTFPVTLKVESVGRGKPICILED